MYDVIWLILHFVQCTLSTLDYIWCILCTHSASYLIWWRGHHTLLLFTTKHTYIPNSRKFSTVHISRKCLQTLQKRISRISFALNKRTTFRTPPVDCYVLHSNLAARRNDETKKASLGNNCWLFHVEAIAFTKVSGLPPRARTTEKLSCRTEGVSATDLDFDSFGAS